MREVERKFSIHSSFMVPTFDDGFGSQPGQTAHLRATYYDTNDLRLARHGVTLRYRTDEPRGVWTVKLPVAGATAEERDELSFEGAPHALPEEARSLVTAYARNEPLNIVARIHTKRRSWVLTPIEGEPVAEISEDEVSILEDRRVVARFKELELESRGATPDTLDTITNLLLEAGAVPAEPIPKAVRALGPRATAAPDIAAPEPVKPKDPTSAAVRAAIAHGAHRIMLHDAPTRLGDPEGIHQMRVGARRLRSDLETFGSLVDERWASELKEHLKWLGRCLGNVRDLDVQQERVSTLRQVLGDALGELSTALAAKQSRMRSDLMTALRDQRYIHLLDLLVAGAREPMLREAATSRCEDVLPTLVRDVWRKLKRKADALSPGADAEAFHDVRIGFKKVRYAAEATGPCLGKDAEAAAKFARRMSRFQELLGKHQDALVSVRLLHSFAGQHSVEGPLNLTFGRAIERELAAADTLRHRFLEMWKGGVSDKQLRWMRG